MKQHSVLKGARALFVEDNEVNQALALARFGDEDSAVTAAHHGAQALDLLARRVGGCR